MQLFFVAIPQKITNVFLRPFYLTLIYSFDIQKWGLRKRFLLTTFIFLLVGIGSLCTFIYFAMQKNTTDAIHEQLIYLEQRIKDEILSARSLLSTTVAIVSSLPEVTQSMENENREELKNFILPYIERIRALTSNTSLYFHFHLSSSTSFLRTWDINKWGDDLSKYRMMVVRANRELASFTGFEIGQGGPVLRSITPIIANGKHLGSVEVAINIVEILQKISLTQNNGILIVLNKKSIKNIWEIPPNMMLIDEWMIIKSFGNSDNFLASKILQSNMTSGRIGNVFFNRIPIQDFQEVGIGEFIFSYNATIQIQKNLNQISQFIWLFLIGSTCMWIIIYFNVKRIKRFLDKLQGIIMDSQNNNFSNRFDCEPIHCKDIIQCTNTDCPVYHDRSLVCYLETGSEAVALNLRNRCNLIQKYESCQSCPVYKIAHTDEIANMSHHVNTMMRSWSIFLNRVGMLLSEVLRNQNQPWNLPSLDQVSEYLEQMAKLTAYTHDLQGVYTREEVYKQLSYVFESHFLLHEYILMEVSPSENYMTIAMQKHTDKHNLIISQDVVLNSDLCRAKRVAEEICSYPNPVLCPYFNCNHDEYIRCCLPMVMSGKVGAIFSFIVLKTEWDIRRKQLVFMRRYLDETAPMLSSLRLLQITREQSLRDPLTQSYNRRFMDAYIAQYEPITKRNDSHVGFLMIDIDYFKQVNDEFGHNSGDSILQQVVKVMFANIRSSDMLIRYGGEEFLILLPDVEPDALLSIGEKIRLAVEGYNFILPNGSKINKTISIGLAIYPNDSETFYKTIKCSDIALYTAKKLGRNRVISFRADINI